MTMTVTLIMLTAALAQGGAPEPLVATPDDAAAMRLHVGRTGILCARLPCPSKAVYIPDDKAATPRHLPYTDRDGRTPPPPMIGDDIMLAEIGRAWKDYGCLAIDGRLISREDDRPVLRVDRIVGPCEKDRG